MLIVVLPEHEVEPEIVTVPPLITKDPPPLMVVVPGITSSELPGDRARVELS